MDGDAALAGGEGAAPTSGCAMRIRSAELPPTAGAEGRTMRPSTLGT